MYLYSKIADIGFEGRIDVSETWFLTAGIKESVGYRDVDYTDTHVGVNLLF